MKKYAFFLPQYHTIPENDKWWGMGFTEWTNVRKAKPLYRGHVQPRHPFGGNYYNLLDRHTVEWQTELMNSYGIDGLIYYHYNFCGKRLLEKPAENLLKWRDINQHFFFCWANHNWNRSWAGSRKILIEQKYGTIDDWEKHFDYLLQFFRDERYVKIDNKPVFMLYDSFFEEKKEMMACFDKKSIEAGFDGIFLIETYTGETNGKAISLSDFRNNICDQTMKIHFREHLVSYQIFKTLYYYYPLRIICKINRKICRIFNKPAIVKWNGNVFYRIIRQKEPREKDIIHGLFFEWDNTPRHGERGFVISPPTKKEFMRTMSSLRNEEYLFINAWNEWAEGMVLEPSEENGNKYLEWIKECTATT